MFELSIRNSVYVTKYKAQLNLMVAKNHARKDARTGPPCLFEQINRNYFYPEICHCDKNEEVVLQRTRLPFYNVPRRSRYCKTS